MALLDGPMRALSRNLHRTFGKDVTATISSTDGYNPALGYAERTESTATVYGVMGMWSEREIRGDIRTSDIKFSMAAQGNTAPDVGDRFTIDSKVYEVVGVVPVWSGDQVATYKVALRA